GPALRFRVLLAEARSPWPRPMDRARCAAASPSQATASGARSASAPWVWAEDSRRASRSRRESASPHLRAARRAIGNRTEIKQDRCHAPAGIGQKRSRAVGVTGLLGGSGCFEDRMPDGFGAHLHFDRHAEKIAGVTETRAVTQKRAH